MTGGQVPHVASQLDLAIGCFQFLDDLENLGPQDPRMAATIRAVDVLGLLGLSSPADEARAAVHRQA